MSRSFLPALSIIFISLFFFSCQKELSFEVGQQAEGNLQGAGAQCLPKFVAGTYTANQALGDTNYIDVTVNVTSAGVYTLSTDTVNGYYFRASGNFSDTGLVTVKLMGFGTPAGAGIDNFIVQFGGSACVVDVTVVPGTGGSGGSAVFTLEGAGGACTLSNVAGTYTQGTALTGANQVILSVNVTTIGTWSLNSNSVTGMAFAGAGTFTTTGVQNITLTGSGTPTTEGAQTFSVSAGTGSCTFVVTVNAGTSTPPPPGSDYFPRTVNSNWGYEFDDDPTDTIMRVSTNQTHAAGGNNFTIFLATVDATQGYDSSGYFRKSGGNYYEFHDIGDIYGFDNPIWQEYIFLKDDQPANTSWYSPETTGTISSQPLTIREKFKILEKDVTVTVNSISFPNTIVVEQRIEQYNGATWVDVSSVVGLGKWYYARGIGLIKLEFTSPSGVQKTEIFRHLVY